MDNLGTWIKNPATRRYLYGVATAVVPLLVGLGVVGADDGILWLAVVGAILGMGATSLAAVNTPTKGDPQVDALNHMGGH